ncbi:MAG TPA: hypothetical protein VMW31_00150, partial [Devosiaceae bacterium]|nr:hypothetical protein [Devosiaceae bacterium]
GGDIGAPGMLTGPQALKSLNEALDEIREEERTIAERLSRTSEKVARLRETETGYFRALAEERLSPEARIALTGRLSAAELRAREMLEKHSADIAETQDRLKTLDASLSELAAARLKEVNKLGDAHAALDQLSDQVAEALEKDRKFVAQRAEVQRLFEIAERATAKTEQAEADREAKGRPYRSDPLFMYLWERGYGTKNYRATNLVRALDGWVARMVRYHDARPNFAMLNEIPMRLREHAERLKAGAEAAGDALETAEVAAVDKAGGKSSRQAIEAAQAAIDRIDADIVEAEDERDELARVQRQLAEGGDPAFREAAQMLAQSLVHEDIGALYAQAQATENGRDDSIVAQIDQTRRQIADDEAEGRGDRDRLKVLAARRRELEDIEWEFKKQRFDDPRSTFDKDELVGDLLSEFLRGAITAATYWGAWRNSQNWRESTQRAGGRIGLPRDPFRDLLLRSGGGQPRSTPGGGGISWGKLGGALGGALSRPRSGSSGSRKHGGFKTGGKF